MRRRIRIAFCITCLLAAVGVVVLNIRSLFVGDVLHFSAGASGHLLDVASTECWMESNRGCMTVEISAFRWHSSTRKCPFPGTDGPVWSVNDGKPMRIFPTRDAR